MCAKNVKISVRENISLYSASPKKLYTFEMAAKNKIYDSGGKGLYAWKAHRLNFHMNPKSPKRFMLG